MNRERALKIVLVLVGLIFLFGVYPLMMFLWSSGWRWQPNQPVYEQMILGVYATLGIFLLLAARNPSENRSLIAFTAWSSLVHATIYGCSGISPCERTRTSAGRHTCACYCRRCADRARASKAIGVAGIGIRCVGSLSGKTPTPTSPSSSKPKPSTRSCNSRLPIRNWRLKVARTNVHGGQSLAQPASLIMPALTVSEFATRIGGKFL